MDYGNFAIPVLLLLCIILAILWMLGRCQFKVIRRKKTTKNVFHDDEALFTITHDIQNGDVGNGNSDTEKKNSHNNKENDYVYNGIKDGRTDKDAFRQHICQLSLDNRCVSNKSSLKGRTTSDDVSYANKVDDIKYYYSEKHVSCNSSKQIKRCHNVNCGIEFIEDDNNNLVPYGCSSVTNGCNSQMNTFHCNLRTENNAFNVQSVIPYKANYDPTCIGRNSTPPKYPCSGTNSLLNPALNNDTDIDIHIESGLHFKVCYFSVYCCWNSNDVTAELIKYHDKIKMINCRTALYYCTDCVICQEQFTKDRNICMLQCRHVFDVKCILKWLSQQKKCPLCWIDIGKETIL